MRRPFGETLRTPRHVVTGSSGRGGGSRSRRSTATAAAAAATAAASSAVRAAATAAATATASTARERIVALADAVDGASLWRQGWLALLQRRRRRCRRRRRARLSVSGGAAVALATTTPCCDDLATVLTPHRLRDQPQVHALPANGQHPSAVAGTPVHPQLAIPSDVGDSPTAASSSFLHPLSVIETEPGLVSPTMGSRLVGRDVFPRRRIADEAMWE